MGAPLAALPRCERGFVSVQFVAATGLSLVLLAMLANLVVFQYGRGVVRAAVDEAARAGAQVRAQEATGECERRAMAVVGDLLGGALAHDVTVTCRSSETRIEATAVVTLSAWLPLYPDWTFAETAVALTGGEG